MRIYWYWPFAQTEEEQLFDAVPGAGDHLAVHVLDRPGAPAARDTIRVQVRADLPEIDRRHTRTVRWALDRRRVFVQRNRLRDDFLRTYEPDIIHVLFLNRFSDALFFRRERRQPLVLSVHDVLPHTRRLGPLEDALLRRFYRGADHLVVHHEWVRNRLQDRFPESAPVTVIPLQVPPPLMIGQPNPHEPPVVLLFGALRRNKGIGFALEAVLRSEGEWLLVIAGRGDPEVESQVAAASHASDRIRFEHGRITPERKAELHRTASMVVLPYTSFESNSAVLHDAYAYGLPVVASNVGALGGEISEHGTGWVVQPADAGALADRIDRAIRDPAALRAAAEACRVQARRRHPTEVGSALRAFYDQVIDEHSRS